MGVVRAGEKYRVVKKNGVDTTVFSLRFLEPSLRLQPERVGSDTGAESYSILFSRSYTGKYRSNRKNRLICNSKLFRHKNSRSKSPGQSSWWSEGVS